MCGHQCTGAVVDIVPDQPAHGTSTVIIGLDYKIYSFIDISTEKTGREIISDIFNE